MTPIGTPQALIALEQITKENAVERARVLCGAGTRGRSCRAKVGALYDTDAEEGVLLWGWNNLLLAITVNVPDIGPDVHVSPTMQPLVERGPGRYVQRERLAPLEFAVFVYGRPVPALWEVACRDHGPFELDKPYVVESIRRASKVLYASISARG